MEYMRYISRGQKELTTKTTTKMKKLIAIVMMLLPMLAWGQDANLPQSITNEVSADGRNLVESLFCKIDPSGYGINSGITPQIFFKGKEILSYGLSLTIANQWVNIEKGAPIIVKLSNGQILEGKATAKAIHDAYDYRDLGPDRYYKFSTIWYEFSSGSIDKMREFGITKLRASDGVTFYDYSIGELANSRMKEGYDFLEVYIKNKPSLYDGF